MKGLSKRLLELRKRKHMTLEELSKVIDVSKMSISNWENGLRNPKSKHIKKYAEYFGVTEDWIIYGDLYDKIYSTVMNELDSVSYCNYNQAPTFARNIFDFYIACIDDKVFDDDNLKDLLLPCDDYYIPLIAKKILFNMDGLDKTVDENLKKYNILTFKPGYFEDFFKKYFLYEEGRMPEEDEIMDYMIDEVRDSAIMIEKSKNKDKGHDGDNADNDDIDYYPNITNLISKLEKIRDRDKKDISQGIYEAINKLLD